MFVGGFWQAVFATARPAKLANNNVVHFMLVVRWCSN
jgi:hypothetical protein